jgi:hypothetical protein
LNLVRDVGQVIVIRVAIGAELLNLRRASSGGSKYDDADDKEDEPSDAHVNAVEDGPASVLSAGLAQAGSATAAVEKSQDGTDQHAHKGALSESLHLTVDATEVSIED